MQKNELRKMSKTPNATLLNLSKKCILPLCLYFVSTSPGHYLDLSTQSNEPEKLLTSNIHLLSPQKWSQFVHLNRENIFLRGQPEICPGFLVISKIESTYS